MRGTSDPQHISKHELERILKAASETEVKVALENLGEEELDVLQYLLSVNHPNLGFCYDSGHSQAYTPNQDLLSQYGDRLMAVHLHDNLGKDDEHLVPFDGVVDFDKVAKGIAATEYDGPVTLESYHGLSSRYDGVGQDEFLAKAYESARRLRRMIKYGGDERVV
jgi:sugar phosphate isomerase/epimerase